MVDTSKPKVVKKQNFEDLKVTRDDVATTHLPQKSDVAIQVADSHWPRGDLAPKFARFQKSDLGRSGGVTHGANVIESEALIEDDKGRSGLGGLEADGHRPIMPVVAEQSLRVPRSAVERLTPFFYRSDGTVERLPDLVPELARLYGAKDADGVNSSTANALVDREPVPADTVMDLAVEGSADVQPPKKKRKRAKSSKEMRVDPPLDGGEKEVAQMPPDSRDVDGPEYGHRDIQIESPEDLSGEGSPGEDPLRFNATRWGVVEDQPSLSPKETAPSSSRCAPWGGSDPPSKEILSAPSEHVTFRYD
ncbi:hypothetical protein Bca101_026551 [Brassica carinata]